MNIKIDNLLIQDSSYLLNQVNVIWKFGTNEEELIFKGTESQVIQYLREEYKISR